MDPRLHRWVMIKVTVLISASGGQHLSAAWCSSWLSPIEACDGDNSCLIPRLGGSMAKEVSPGGLVPSVERTVHQCPRTPDCVLGTEALLTLSQEQERARPHRQHLSGVSHQPSRRDQVTGDPEGSPGTMDMGSSSVGLLEGDAPPRQGKLCGRFPLTPEATPWGMAAAPAGSDLRLVLGDSFASECTTHLLLVVGIENWFLLRISSN